MCIIAICEQRALTKKEFDNCWDSNSHGMGFAHWDGSQVVAGKGYMQKKEAWDIYACVPVPHVVHFRIRSAGSVSPELTHPFIISPQSNAFSEFSGQDCGLLFHNGTVSDWKELVIMAAMHTKSFPEGEMSDSRAMAIAVSVAGERMLEYFNYHKWVVVDKSGFRKYGDWVEGKDGLLFSNGGFRSHETKVSTRYVNVGDWPVNTADYTGQGVHSATEAQRTFGGRTWDKLCSQCMYYYSPTDNTGAECMLHDHKLKDKIACKDWTEDFGIPPAIGEDEDPDEGSGETSVSIRAGAHTCESCCSYLGIKSGRPFCKHLGKMKNTNKCGRYIMKAAATNASTSTFSGKSCKTCAYLMPSTMPDTCGKRGKLKDMVACKDYVRLLHAEGEKVMAITTAASMMDLKRCSNCENWEQNRINSVSGTCKHVAGAMLRYNCCADFKKKEEILFN